MNWNVRLTWKFMSNVQPSWNYVEIFSHSLQLGEVDRDGSCLFQALLKVFIYMINKILFFMLGFFMKCNSSFKATPVRYWLLAHNNERMAVPPEFGRASCRSTSLSGLKRLLVLWDFEKSAVRVDIDSNLIAIRDEIILSAFVKGDVMQYD